MDALSSFIPMDRRQALAQGAALPPQTTGAARLTDLAGYTALTGAFVAARGPQAGGEAVFRALAPLFATQIDLIHAYRGSVLTFSGDALTCWFDADDGARALAAACALQAAMRAAPPLRLPDGTSHALALKTVLAAGPARRFLVGDPALGLVDVLAGAPLARLGAGEPLAAGGEILLDDAVATATGATGPARPDPEDATAGPFLCLATPPAGLPAPTPWPPLPPDALTEAQLRPWVPPVLWPRLRAAATFWIELRPAVVLFLRFAGIDYTRPPRGAPRTGARPRAPARRRPTWPGKPFSTWIPAGRPTSRRGSWPTAWPRWTRRSWSGCRCWVRRWGSRCRRRR
ncbi:MAG TPA: hypothetical protein VKY74_17115 [Chloroflexia bacterium]|nr:hypothetical protein [Chloroflexia bacterium]